MLKTIKILGYAQATLCMFAGSYAGAALGISLGQGDLSWIALVTSLAFFGLGLMAFYGAELISA